MVIKAICFDLDGMVFEKIHDKFVKNLALRLKKDEDYIRNILFVEAYNEGDYNSLRKGLIKFNKYFYWFKNKVNEENLTEDDYRNILHKDYRINKDIIKKIKKLKKLGYKTMICSNNYEFNISGLESKFDFLKYFDTKVFSYEVGFLKPDKRIFQELVKRSGVNPEEILYSDDCEEKLVGAKEIGIQTFVFRDFDQFMAELRNRGVNI